ncbi:MAG: response regulator [Candidatus Aadella gelida]|nr:response regulator [Candidatus Aadella gelida]
MEKKVVATIDDEKEVIDMISNYLNERGFIVAGFQRPEEFLAYLDITLPDIILLDVMFPGYNTTAEHEVYAGYEVCKYIKSSESIAEIPIILVSAKSSEEDKVDGLNLGAVDYVVKPFSLEKLRSKIERALESIRILKVEQRFKRMKKRELERRKIKMEITEKREDKKKRIKEMIDQLSLEQDGASPESGTA